MRRNRVATKLGTRWGAAAWIVMGIAAAAGPASAQWRQDSTEFDVLIETLRLAWLNHEYKALVEGSDTVRLQLPGVGRAPAMRAPQAARVLRGYLKAANEIAFHALSTRNVSPEHAYVELVRRYVVQGTSDERVETVFLGLRRVEGVWVLREVRVTP